MPLEGVGNIVEAPVIVLETTVGAGSVTEMNREVTVISASSTSATATTVIWPTWNKAYTNSSNHPPTTIGGGNSASTSWAASAMVWTNWSNAYVTTSAITTDPWILWNSTVSPTTYGTGSFITRPAVQISDEEYQARLAHERSLALEREARYRTEQLEREAAKRRAELLLRENLTDKQKAELADKRYFTLTKIDSETGERRHYRIHHGRAGNVEQVDENGRRLGRFCIHPSMACPDEDTMLAQKLWLETQEDEFRRVANKS